MESSGRGREETNNQSQKQTNKTQNEQTINQKTKHTDTETNRFRPLPQRHTHICISNYTYILHNHTYIILSSAAFAMQGKQPVDAFNFTVKAGLTKPFGSASVTFQTAPNYVNT